MRVGTARVTDCACAHGTGVSETTAALRERAENEDHSIVFEEDDAQTFVGDAVRSHCAAARPQARGVSACPQDDLLPNTPAAAKKMTLDKQAADIHDLEDRVGVVRADRWAAVATPSIRANMTHDASGGSP